MFTNIQQVTNNQAATKSGGVAFANNEKGHVGEGWACVPGFLGDVGRYLPIPRQDEYDQGLWIYTTKGCCQVIDKDWQITGLWDDGIEVILLGKGEGAGGNVNLVVDANGGISISKA